MPYINYDENGNITGQFACQQYKNQVYTDLIIDDVEKFKVINKKIVKNSNYEIEQAQKEIERISNLKLTKRVFALALQQLEVTYTQLKAIIATNEQAQLEWDLCVMIERKNPLLNIMCANLQITSEQLDKIFIEANNL